MKSIGKRVLVTGGTGFIGGRLVEKLSLEHETEVRVLVHNFSNASRIARFDLEMVVGDIGDQSFVDKVVKDCDLIFHCAYDFKGTHRQRKRNNIGGTENITKAALRHNTRLVHVSTFDVYGKPSDGCIDEKTPKKIDGDIYAKTKLAAEEIVLKYHRRYNLPVTVIQPTIVYGPFSRPWTITPVKQIKNGKVVLVEGGKGCCNAVYIDDVVDAMILAATNEKAIGETFLISGSKPVTWEDFYNSYEKMLDLNATIPLSIKEIEKAQHLQNRNTALMNQFVLLLRDPAFQTRMAQIPAMRRLYVMGQDYLPNSIWNNITRILFEHSTKFDEIDATSSIEDPMYLPDSAKLKLYRSRARVKIDKAQQLLGYEPKFDFGKGMMLTEQFIRWANLL